MKWPRKILSQGSQTLTLIHQVLTDNISMDDGQLTVHSVLNQGFLYTNFDFFYKTSQTVLLVLTFLDMMFEQEAVPVS